MTRAWILLTIAACTSSAPAAEPFDFTPSACGRATCDFADRVAVGATVSVALTVAATGVAVAAPTLGSSDPTVLEVTTQSSTEPASFTLTAHGAGTAALIAIAHDATGAAGDSARLAVDVAQADDVLVTLTAAGDGSPLAPVALSTSTDQYALAVGTDVTLTARPAATGAELTGALTFAVTVAPAIVDNLEAGSLSAGAAELIVPAGANDVTFAVTGGAQRTVELTGE